MEVLALLLDRLVLCRPDVRRGDPVRGAAGLAPEAGQAWAVVFAATMAVSAIGYILIAKNRPNPEQGSAPATTIQHDGVSS
jgi:hypothetical protein